MTMGEIQNRIEDCMQHGAIIRFRPYHFPEPVDPQLYGWVYIYANIRNRHIIYGVTSYAQYNQ